MVTHRRRHEGGEFIELSLEARFLYVSYLSSLLMVVQAALRELANYSERTKSYLEATPQPVLVISRVENGKHLKLRFSFVDPSSRQMMSDLSSSVFAAFITHFIRFLKEQPQPGLWGPSTRAPRPREYGSELERRLDQFRLELRHFDRATLAYGNRRVRIEGDRVEIEELGQS